MTILSRAIQKNNKGQALVEMALVISLLTVLIFGMTEFGRAMYTKNTLTNAARTGARDAVVRIGIVNCSGVSLTAPVAADATIFTAISNSIPAAINQSTVTVTLQLYDKDSGSPKSAPALPGDQVGVTVQAPFTPVLSLMQRMLSGPLSGQATMRYE